MKNKVGFAMGAIVGITLGGTAMVVASIPDSVTGVVTSCLKSNGSIIVIDAEAGRTCGLNETVLRWNQVGPQGEPGPQGDPGPAGPQGESGVVVSASNLLPMRSNSTPYVDVPWPPGVEAGEVFTSAWAPLYGDAQVAALQGWSSDFDNLPPGTQIRIDAIYEASRYQVDGGDVYPFAHCVRLANELGPILGSETCATQDSTWIGNREMTYEYLTETYGTTHLLGPSVDAFGLGTNLYIEQFYSATAVPNPYMPESMVNPGTMTDIAIEIIAPAP